MSIEQIAKIGHRHSCRFWTPGFAVVTVWVSFEIILIKHDISVDGTSRSMTGKDNILISCKVRPYGTKRFKTAAKHGIDSLPETCHSRIVMRFFWHPVTQITGCGKWMKNQWINIGFTVENADLVEGIFRKKNLIKE